MDYIITLDLRRTVGQFTYQNKPVSDQRKDMDTLVEEVPLVLCFFWVTVQCNSGLESCMKGKK